MLASNEPAGSTGVSTVTATIHHTDAVVVTVTLDGEALETTPAHPFSVLLRGWVNAEDLRPGMAVRRADGISGAVEGVAVEQRTQAMNHLTVADAHTFVVGDDGWVVHNNTCDLEQLRTSFYQEFSEWGYLLAVRTPNDGG